MSEAALSSSALVAQQREEARAQLRADESAEDAGALAAAQQHEALAGKHSPAKSRPMPKEGLPPKAQQ